MTMRAFFAAAALLAMAGTALAEAGVIRGQATTGGPIELKPGTVLEVELLDVSRADAPGEKRGSVSVPVRRLGPIPFVLSYDPAAIEAGNRYAVSARLVQDGRVTMQSEGATPVLTGGAGTTAEIALVPLAQPQAVAAANEAVALVGTWKLGATGGEGAVAGVEFDPHPHRRRRGARQRRLQQLPRQLQPRRRDLPLRPDRRHPPRLPAAADAAGDALLRGAGGHPRGPRRGRRAPPPRRRRRHPPAPRALTAQRTATRKSRGNGKSTVPSGSAG